MEEKIKQNKTAKIIGIVVISVMAIFLVVALVLNSLNLGANKTLYESMRIEILQKETKVGVIEMMDISALEQKTFRTTYKTSGQLAKEVEYTGVLLRDILAAKNLDLVGKKNVTVTAVDSITRMYSVKDILNTDDIYLVHKCNGETLLPRSKMGDGPFMIVVKGLDFSQDWCKYVVSIEVD